jgi:hypothetical protein
MASRVANKPKDSICISLQIGGCADYRFIAGISVLGLGFLIGDI